MNSFRERLLAFFESFHRIELPDAGFTRAAVLVPIFERDGEPYFLLTKRTDDVEHHKGQISFPGGAVDSTDSDIVTTALRETEEEIGLARERIHVVGVFNDISIPTGFIVTPVVGYVDSLPTLKLSTREVTSIIEAPFTFFQDPKNKKVLSIAREGKTREVYSFRFGEFEIWGATAFIIDSFLHELTNRS
jgi:8-oxo-dGTP pyrophosphatase MutT (NUDIX family)